MKIILSKTEIAFFVIFQNSQALLITFGKNIGDQQNTYMPKTTIKN